MNNQMTNTIKSKNIAFINMDTPYKGTILATPEKLKEKVDRLYIIGDYLWKVYCKTFVWTTVGRDVALGSSYLEELDYSHVKNFQFINVIASTSVISLFKDIIWFNAEGIGCYILNLLLGLEGDGIVPNDSEEINNVITLRTDASHASTYEHNLKDSLELIK